jgi:hypothetical protein
MSGMLRTHLKDVDSGDHAISRHKFPAGLLSLPSVEEVREEALKSGNPRAKNHCRPPPVEFPALGLLVKYGSQVSIAEAHCLIFVRENLPNIRVPDM